MQRHIACLLCVTCVLRVMQQHHADGGLLWPAWWWALQCQPCCARSMLLPSLHMEPCLATGNICPCMCSCMCSCCAALTSAPSPATPGLRHGPPMYVPQTSHVSVPASNCNGSIMHLLSLRLQPVCLPAGRVLV